MTGLGGLRTLARELAATPADPKGCAAGMRWCPGGDLCDHVVRRQFPGGNRPSGQK